MPVGSISAKKWTFINQDLFLHNYGSLRQALPLLFNCFPPLSVLDHGTSKFRGAWWRHFFIREYFTLVIAESVCFQMYLSSLYGWMYLNWRRNSEYLKIKKVNKLIFTNISGLSCNLTCRHISREIPDELKVFVWSLKCDDYMSLCSVVFSYLNLV